MPDDLQRLQRKIEEGLEAVRELKKLEAERKKQERPKLRLIKGSAIGAAVGAGVEWLWGYKAAVAVAAAAVAFTGGVIAEQPDSPGSDPPDAIKPPASVSPSVKPAPRPTAKPTIKPSPRPPRTSPLRTLGRSGTPVVAPTTPRKTVQPTRTPRATPTATPTPTPSLTETVVPTLRPSATPAIVVPPCAVDLLGVKVCLPRGRS